MSTLKTGALRGTSGTADSIQLHASNQSVTFPGAVTVTGDLTSNQNVKYTTSSVASLNGTALAEFTLPSNCFRCWFAVKGMSSASSSEKVMKVKAGGSVITTGYYATSAKLENSTDPSLASSDAAMFKFTAGYDAAGHARTGIVEFVLYDDHDWIWTWQDFGDEGNTVNVSAGSIALSSELQAVQFISSTGNFDGSGKIKGHFFATT